MTVALLQSGHQFQHLAAERTALESGTVIVVSPDVVMRQRLAQTLAGMRWQVREAGGGAQALLLLEERGAKAMLVDGWLPDLEINEFVEQIKLLHPEIELFRLDCAEQPVLSVDTGTRSRRNELLHAVRTIGFGRDAGSRMKRGADGYRVRPDGSITDGSLSTTANPEARATRAAGSGGVRDELLPGLVGQSAAMRELSELVRMVAPRMTTVLIEGETGTGKELVARALHLLSSRPDKPFVVLNCAAIPEALLEAELFGHVRGAFTGAMQSRVGRIEMASGGTLLLDEIGEMPVAMQAKLLRFLETREMQRVGDNQTTRVDVRLIAATHQPLERRSVEGTFRADLYYRLAVFPIEAPALRERLEDVAALAEHFLDRVGQENPREQLSSDALDKLERHDWPGNVRELLHVLERGTILACARPEVSAEDIRYRRSSRG